jgi:type IV pilus assembly protein PilV
LPTDSPARIGTQIHTPHTAARGFTVLEILAALLVIAVGIIGVAALYSDAVHTNTEVQFHTQAAALAEEMAQRIQANPQGRAGYAGTVGVVCDRDTKPKLPQDAAANEAACWETRVEQALPSGLGTIVRDTTTTPVRYLIAVSWSAPEKGAASYVIQVTPK